MHDPVKRNFQKGASTRAYRLVLLLVVLAIVYGSLFPFNFRETSHTGGPLLYLLGTWRAWDGRGDLLANVLLYLPFGFLAVQAQPRHIPATLKLIIALAVGVALSGAVEICQFYDVGRVTSMGDVYANLIGTAVGAAAGILLGASWRWPFIGDLAGNPVEAVLLTMFFAYRLFPYVPVIDLHKYWHAVRPTLMTPGLPPDEFLRYFVTWLFVSELLQVVYGFGRYLFVFPLVCGAEFLGRIVIIGSELKLNDLLSAAGAWLVSIVLLRRAPGRYGLLTLLFAAMIAIERLQPFRFEAFPRAFGWIPFSSFMQGSIGVDIQAFCQKFYEYGGLIWLLNRGGMRLASSTALTAAFLFATSFAERWLPGRSAEITDGMIALLLGGTFALLAEQKSRSCTQRIGNN
jgi:VanZ family protein